MRSASGVFGDPTKATTGAGRVYLAAKIEDLLAFLREFVALLVCNPVVHGLACAVLMAGGLALTQVG